MDIKNLIAPNFYQLHLDIQEHRHSIYRLKGGRGSLKTSTIIVEVLSLMQKYPDICTCVFMKQGNRIRQGAFAAYINMIARAGLQSLYDISYSPMRITNNVTGQVIIFLGLDDANKTKGVAPPPGKVFGICHWEELDSFSGNNEIDTAMDSIIRGGDISWCFQCYNPPANANNWVNKDSLIDVPGRLIHSSDYRSVPVEWLGKAFIERAAACFRRSEREYRWRYLGEIVGVEGLIFRNITQYDLSNGYSADLLFQGIDLGYEDPLAFIRLGYNIANRDLYLLDEFYERHVINDDLAKWILDKGYIDMVSTMESSRGGEPVKACFNKFGVPVRLVNKGNNLLLSGISFLQGCSHIYIDPSVTPNAWEEFNLYEWKKDKDGNTISPEVPVDRNNHLIDATRYALSKHIKVLGGLS